MSFHLGKPILVMIIVALAGTIIVLARPTMKRPDQVVWTFAESHQKSYTGATKAQGEAPLAKYTRLTGIKVDMVLMNGRAEDIRLLSIFNTHGKNQIVPDAVEIEISKIGKFFRPPIDDIGLLPLNEFLKKSGWYDQVVKARFAPWSKNGVIFGVPHDLHPTTITYRKDLFDEAGVDLAAANTWPRFRDACRQFRKYWLSQSHPRWAAGLSRTSSDNVVIMLQQRHVNLIDDQNQIHLNDPKVTNTVRVYAEMVGGSDAVGTDFNPAPGMNYRDVANGDVCAMITPDWMVGYMKLYSADAQGKCVMMPLPIFDPGDSPTASWGGTMIGIPRDCRDPEAAWKLIEAMYFDHDSVAYRRQTDAIIPPIRKYWSDEVYHQPDPYFYNAQNSSQLFIDLADQLPVRYVTPFTIVAQQLLSDVVNKTVKRIDSGDTANLDADIQRWLDDSAADLKRRIDFATFED